MIKKEKEEEEEEEKEKEKNRRKEEEKKKKKNLSSVIKARAICAYSSDVPNEALSKML